jgi:hypothetical protein
VRFYRRINKLRTAAEVTLSIELRMPTFLGTTIAPSLSCGPPRPIPMVDPEIIEEVKKAIDALEADVRKKISRGEGQLTARTTTPAVETRKAPSIYTDALDALVLCRGAANSVNNSQEYLSYLLNVMQALERARVLYVETSTDKGGYGNATFHMIIRQIRNLYESLAAIAEFVETQAEEGYPEEPLIQ